MGIQEIAWLDRVEATLGDPDWKPRRGETREERRIGHENPGIRFASGAGYAKLDHRPTSQINPLGRKRLVRTNYSRQIIREPIEMEVVRVGVVQESIAGGAFQPWSRWQRQRAHEHQRRVRRTGQLPLASGLSLLSSVFAFSLSRFPAFGFDSQINGLLERGNAVGQIPAIADIGFADHLPSIHIPAVLVLHRFRRGKNGQQILGQRIAALLDRE